MTECGHDRASAVASSRGGRADRRRRGGALLPADRRAHRGRFAFEEFTLGAGIVGARPHVHAGHDEYFYVLDGELTLHNGDGEVTVGPGHLLSAVRGTPHGFRNAGTGTVRALCLYTPAGYEGYFREVHAAVAAGAEVTDELLAEFRSRYRTASH
ncbi:cupin domain-containing protein [Nonomuraea sp. NPDC059194]|uniref:cupin domain-containing protein n=1 Tax=Nonomuraea sp. NPDC059194 TaxID=3346764 RepID=UPI0036AE1134